MNKSIFLLLFFIVASCSKKEIILDIPIVQTTGEIQLVNTYGGSKNEAINAIVSTNDGGYAVLGYTQSNDGDVTDKTDDSFDYYVLKFSADGEKEWSKTYGGSDEDRGNDIIQTSDDGFAILGSSQSNDIDISQNAGSQDFWIVKLDSFGNISWQKSFGYPGADYGTTLIETSDNGYLVTGVLDVTASGGEGNSRRTSKHAGGDVWAIKISAIGVLEWSKFYGGGNTDTPLGIVKTDDNSFIIACSSDSEDVDITDNNGSYDFWILKISNTGVLLWEKSFGGTEIDEARAITRSEDGNFIIVGDTRSSNGDVTLNNGAADVWMLKINTEGNLLWQKTIGGASFDVARSISKTQDNGFVIAGSSRSLDNGFTNQGQNDGLILKVDSEGEVVWKKTVGGSDFDFCYDAVQLTDGSIIGVGETRSLDGNIKENKGFADMLIVKIK